MRAVICVVVWAICAHAVAATAADSEQEAYLDFLVREALSQNLADERFWILLGHYKKTSRGGYKSQEDGPDFFNSPNGKTDPQAELTATLKSFFKPLEDLKEGEEHPRCNFPARYKWLKTRLAFDPLRLPERECGRLETWLKANSPERITLVFASYYMSNPASMFGHTLLRIDKKREGPEQKLLDYGVNYAASADTANVLLYAFKGMFGGFKGTFSIFPYYVKIQEYNNLENRDLWEYELNFTEDQMNYFLLHLWELGGNYFDYYYFQENCSYHILSVLEVADPDLRLTDPFLFQVIPADTVKVVLEQPGLVGRRVYRPSLLSQMNQKRVLMTDRERKVFHRLTKNPSVLQTEDYLGLEVARKALVLDAYLDYAQFRDMERARTAGVISKKTREILLERSRLDYRRDVSLENREFSTPPELGHGSARIGLGFGRNEYEFFEQISIRPAYHDLLANDLGYGRYSQILFLEFTGRYYDESNKLRLDNFKLFDAISLTPYDRLFRKMSWKLSIGTDTVRDRDCRYCNSIKTNFGMGLSIGAGFFSPVLLYALPEVEIEAARRLDSNGRLGGGGTAGLLIDVIENWRIQVTGQYLSFPLGEQSHYYKVSANQRYSVSQNLDLRVEWNVVSGRAEWMTVLNYYF